MDDKLIYKFIFENAEDAIFILSLDGEILNLNKQASKILGSSKDDLLSQNIFEIHAPNHHDIVKNYLQRLIKSGKELTKEIRLERNENKNHIKLQAQNISYKGENAILCYLRDISEKKSTEQKFDHLIDAIENSVNAVAFADLNGNITYVNSAFLKMWGYSISTEVLGESSVNFWKFEGDAKAVIKKIHNNGSWKGSLIAKGKDGRNFEVEVYANMIIDSKGKEKGMIGWFHDITEKKQMEKHLKRVQERYKLLFETMTQGVVFHNPDGRIFSANPAAVKILGIDEETMNGKNSSAPIWKTIHEDGSYFPSHEHPAQLSIKTGKKVRDTIMGVYNPKKSEYRWININSIPLYKNGDKNPYQVYAIFEDITERKRIKDALKKNKEKLQGILDAITDPVAMIDKDYQILWGNNKLKSTFGEDLTNLKCFEAFYDSDRPCKRCIKNLTLKDGQVHEDEKEIYIGPNREKHYFWCTSNVVERDSSGNPITAIEVGRDITKRRKVEERLKFYKDLITHNIINILNNINIAIQLTKYKKNEKLPLQMVKMLDLIDSQVDDGIKLISNVQMMAEVEEKNLKIIRIDPIRILRKIINDSPISQKKNVSITLNANNADIFVMAGPLLKDIFENIIINGIKHNLSDVKRVRIDISKLILHNKSYVKFNFIDNGVGIPDNIKNKIFTRDHQSNLPSKGMGIGLSLVKKIIKTYKGMIEVKNNNPKGSIFSVILPSA